MANPDSFRCWLVRKAGDVVEGAQEERPLRELPPGDVRIRVLYSSVNSKDVMAAHGHPGITKKFPHVPGIDAAGIVEASESPSFKAGDEVICTGHELGVERWGGWAEQIRVPAQWVVRRPAALSLRESMILGTAGFTAAQCVSALIHHGIAPNQGEIVVSGATGGVGIVSLKLLAKLGYRVVCVSGKPDQAGWLEEHGAAEVLPRDRYVDQTTRPMLSTRWAGGIDTVGGSMLVTTLKSTAHRGCVAACGVVGGPELPLTVYPFILRGVTLAGIDSAWCPDDRRQEIWNWLGGDWKLPDLDRIATTVRLVGLSEIIQKMSHGQSIGRTVIDFT
jgi:putative YhdH/YhfP family quinone oxidoreductase